jgi:Domain of unknown function (DUF4263)
MAKKEFIYDGEGVNAPSFEIACEDLDKFEELLEEAKDENELQTFLDKRKYILAWLEPHCHHVISKPRLGAQFVPDFLLAEMSSAGIQWVFVEIEPAKSQLATQSGQFAERTRMAIQQVKDWKRWLRNNRDYAIRSIPNGGLGLEELEIEPKGIVIVGRRKATTGRFNELRAESRSEGITIMTYDRVLEWARDRASFIGSGPRSLGIAVLQ